MIELTGDLLSLLLADVYICGPYLRRHVSMSLIRMTVGFDTRSRKPW